VLQHFKMFLESHRTNMLQAFILSNVRHSTLWRHLVIRNMCIAARLIAKISLKMPIFGVQGRSRSSMLVPPESSSTVLVMISSKSVSIDALIRGESPHPAAPNYLIRN